MMTYHLNIPINEKTVYLVETLKVEGYWNTKRYTLTLQNKNLSLLNYIEDIVKELGVTPSKRLLVKIRLNDNSVKEKVKILEGDKELNFHIEKSPFDNKKVKAVISLPYKKIYELKIFYLNEIYKLRISSYKHQIKCQGNLQCWVYKDLRFPIKALLDFLDKYGGNKRDLHIHHKLLRSNEKFFMSAFSALIDCGGSINWYGLKRVIRVRMRSKDYLEEWSKLLKEHGIGNKYRRNKNDWELNISGWEDFYKLEEKGFCLHHSEKLDRWKRMMKEFKRHQISRGTYREFYIKKLKEMNKKVTAEEIASFIGKGKRVVSHYLLKLERERLIECNKAKEPYLYFIIT